MEAGSTFGDLRSLMQQHPTRELWEQLCEMLDAADPGELLELWIPYIRGHQRHWPTSLCAAPERWIQTLFRGEDDVPQLSAALSLSVRDRDVGDEEIFELTCSPFVDGLRTLALGYERRVPWRRERITFGCVRDLIKCTHLENLKTLHLTGQHLGAESLAALLSPEGLTALQVLDMSYNDLEFLQPSTLAGISHNLCELALRDTELTLQGITALTEAGLLDGLRRLDLSYNRGLDIRGLIELIETPRWGELEGLGLSGCSLTPGLLSELFAAIPVSSLTRLEIADNALFDEDHGQLLATLRLLGRESVGLRHLDLGTTGLTDRAMIALADSALLMGLEELVLSGNQLGHETIEALVAHDFFLGRTALDFSDNQLGDEGFALLMRSDALGLLETLSLSNNDIGDEALEELEGRCFPEITQLDLSNNRISLDGASRLLRQGLFPKLSSLILNYNTINEYDEDWTTLVDEASKREIRVEASGGWVYDDTPYDYGSEVYEDIVE